MNKSILREFLWTAVAVLALALMMAAGGSVLQQSCIPWMQSVIDQYAQPVSVASEGMLREWADLEARAKQKTATQE